MSYVYLGSPYSHPEPGMRVARCNEAIRAAAWLMKRRVWCFSPIAHCHEMAVRYGLPAEFDYWKEYDKIMIMSAGRLLVLKIDGHDSSLGLAEEVRLARRFNMRVAYLAPRGADYDEEPFS